MKNKITMRQFAILLSLGAVVFLGIVGSVSGLFAPAIQTGEEQEAVADSRTDGDSQGSGDSRVAENLRGAKNGLPRTQFVSAHPRVNHFLKPNTNTPQQKTPWKAWPADHKTFIAKYCSECHDADTKEGKLDFAELPYDLGNTKIRKVWNHVVRQLVENSMPPKDADPHPSKEAKQKFLAKLRADMATADKTARPGGTRLRRLNQVEYFNSIDSIFNFRTHFKPQTFAEESTEMEFDTNPEGLYLSGPLLNSFMSIAMEVADRAVYLPTKDIREYTATNDAISGRAPLLGSSSGKHYTQKRFTGVNINCETGGLWHAAFKAHQAGVYRVYFQVAAESDKGADGKPLRLSFYTAPPREQPKKTSPARATLVARVNVTNQKKHVIEVDVALEKDEAVYAFCDNRFAPDSFPAYVENKFARRAFTKRIVNSKAPSVRYYDLKIRGPLGPLPDQIAFLKNQEPTNDPKYIRSVLVPVAEKAFRRPLSEKEKQKIVQRVLTHAKTSDLRHGIHYAFRAIFSSPNFLYHNVAPDGKMSDYALASRLSYFLWSTIPDQELLDLAKRGTLSNQKVLAQQVARMIRSPKSRKFTNNFTGQWLMNREVSGILINPTRSEFKEPNIQRAAHTATELFFDEILREDLKIRNFIDSNFTYMSDKLARGLGCNLANGTVRCMPTASHLSPQHHPEMLRVEFTLPKPSEKKNVANQGSVDQNSVSLISKKKPKKKEPAKKKPKAGTKNIKMGSKNANKSATNQPECRSELAIKKAGPINKRFAHVRPSPRPLKERGGILGLTGIYLATGDGIESNAIYRGVWVLRNLFGEPLPEPPDNIPALGADTSVAKTLVEKMKLHTQDPNCASCHQKIDPLGLALEHYDAAGQWRDRYTFYTDKVNQKALKKPSDTPQVTFGAAVKSGYKYKGMTLSSPMDIKRYLMKNSHLFTKCLTEKLLIYGTGRELSVGDQRILRELVKQEPKDGYTFQELITKVVQSEAFLAQ